MSLNFHLHLMYDWFELNRIENDLEIFEKKYSH